RRVGHYGPDRDARDAGEAVLVHVSVLLYRRGSAIGWHAHAFVGMRAWGSTPTPSWACHPRRSGTRRRPKRMSRRPIDRVEPRGEKRVGGAIEAPRAPTGCLARGVGAGGGAGASTPPPPLRRGGILRGPARLSPPLAKGGVRGVPAQGSPATVRRSS